VPQIPNDFTVEAQSDEEIFAECAERFKIAEEAESINRINAIEDLEFADGQQWPDDIYNLRKVQRRPSLTINHTATLVRRVINNMREQRPRIKVHPVSDATIDDARVANGLIRHIETLSDAGVAYDTAGESAVRIGWGYIRLRGYYPDPKSRDQEIRIDPVRNPLTGYIDPAAQMPDGSDMDWFIFSDKMKRTKFKRKYPNAQLEDWTHGATGDNQRNWLTKTEIRIAEYYRIKHTEDTLYTFDDDTHEFKSVYESNKQAFDLAGKRLKLGDNGKPVTRPTTRRQVQWFLINGVKVVDKRDLPGQWIPVVRCEGNVLDLNGEVRRKGMIRDLKDPARMFNYWETAKTEKLALSSKAPWVMVEGQADGHPEWDDANQKPYSVLKYKLILGMDGNPLPGVPPPQRQGPVEVEAGFAEASQSAAKNLLMVAGMPHEPSQDTPGTVVSGVALRRRQAISDISHFQYYDNQTRMIAQCGRICLDWIPHYYGEKRMQRIIGDDGVPTMVGINTPKEASSGVMQIAHNMQVGRYDVVMDTGPGYETKRQEAAESMIDLMKTPLGEVVVKTGADIALRNMDFPGADDLADRAMPLNPQGMQKAVENLPHEAKGIVTALMTQNQQLQQQIQQMQLEIKYKSGIEQMRQQGETQRTHIQAVGHAHDVEMRDHTAERDTQVKTHAQVAVAEIGQAGKIIDTHVGGHYDQIAADNALKAAKTAEKANGKDNA
jgi:hypothetical protein